jgi:hypothetical protein
MSSNNDDIELKPLNSKKQSNDSIVLASEEHVSDDETNQNDDSKNEHILNDEEEEEEYDENKENQPFLERNKENIEMRVLNDGDEIHEERDENQIEATSLMQTNNLDAIQVENASLNQDLDEINPQERKKWHRIRKYLSTDNPYVRGFKPTKIKLIALLIFSSIVFVFIFFPYCINSIDYHHVIMNLF